jgi:outer membrane protein assembly factor BamD
VVLNTGLKIKNQWMPLTGFSILGLHKTLAETEPYMPKIPNLSPVSRFLLLGGLLLLASCASNKKAIGTRTEICRQDYEAIKVEFEEGNYWQIKEDLETLLDECTGTGFMEKGMFMLAESHFHLEEWIEARGEYGTFVVNFPASPDVETAVLRKAISTYNMAYRDSRDDSNTEKAIKDFEEFIRRFPESVKSDSAIFFLDELTERMADKDYKTGALYLRMDEPLAAAIYFREFLEDYPKSKHTHNALLKLVDCYTRLEQFDQAEFYIQKIRSEIKDKKMLAQAKDLEEDLDKARKNFKKRIEKELRKERELKEDES